MSQALDKQIQEHLSLLYDDEKKSLLGVIKSFLSHRKDEAARITIEEYNKDIDEAEAEFERGDFITHDELIKQTRKW